MKWYELEFSNEIYSNSDRVSPQWGLYKLREIRFILQILYADIFHNRYNWKMITILVMQILGFYNWITFINIYFNSKCNRSIKERYKDDYKSLQTQRSECNIGKHPIIFVADLIQSVIFTHTHSHIHSRTRNVVIINPLLMRVPNAVLIHLELYNLAPFFRHS